MAQLDGLALALLAALVLLASYAGGAAAQGDPTPTPQAVITSGQVDIGGYALFIDCLGEPQDGGPTVILEAGLPGTGRSWARVHHQLGRFTRACAYDRAGQGGSDDSPIAERTAQTAAEELHALLTHAGIAPPYVLVGHSWGGLYVRRFAYQYPDEVAGMVLVDASHEDQFERLNPSPEAVEQERAAWTDPEGVGLEERDAIFEQLRETRAETATPLGDMPLIVLTARLWPASPQWTNFDTEFGVTEGYAIWVAMQEEMARFSTDSLHIITVGSDHFIQNDQPELVIAAVQQVVEAVHSSVPLDREALEGINQQAAQGAASQQAGTEAGIEAVPVEDPTYPAGAALTIPGPDLMLALTGEPGGLTPAGVCMMGSEATVLQTVALGDDHWFELECAGSSGWARETLFAEE